MCNYKKQLSDFIWDSIYHILIILTAILMITLMCIALQPQFSDTDCMDYNGKTYCAKVGD